jgi:hypothetical protein
LVLVRAIVLGMMVGVTRSSLHRVSRAVAQTTNRLKGSRYVPMVKVLLHACSTTGEETGGLEGTAGEGVERSK